MHSVLHLKETTLQQEPPHSEYLSLEKLQFPGKMPTFWRILGHSRAKKTLCLDPHLVLIAPIF